MTPTIIHHSADYDGLFCREIAKRSLPGATVIGWDFGQPLIPWPAEGPIYILDLPPECLVGVHDRMDFTPLRERVIWIDHHKSSIAKWPANIPGFRIDGVAACRLAWQWFAADFNRVSTNTERAEHWRTWMAPYPHDFLTRKVKEPLAVTLAGEYDVWQHENSNGGDLTFQFGLDTQENLDWDKLLSTSPSYTLRILHAGEHAQACFKKRDADMVLANGFDLDFEGLKFIALNASRGNSETFNAVVRPEHDGCLKFYWNGKTFVVSMYGVAHKRSMDLSRIALMYGGGGHKQACGFQAKTLPWLV